MPNETIPATPSKPVVKTNGSAKPKAKAKATKPKKKAAPKTERKPREIAGREDSTFTKIVMLVAKNPTATADQILAKTKEFKVSDAHKLGVRSQTLRVLQALKAARS